MVTPRITAIGVAVRAAQTHAAVTIERATTPAERAQDTETMAGVEADGGSPDVPARSSKEPSAKESLMERLARVLPTLDEEPAAPPSVSHEQASGSALASAAGSADASAAQSATRFSSYPQSTPRVPEQGVEIGDGLPSHVSSPSEPAAETVPQQEATTEAPEEKVHYVVWEVELSARIYKVPEGKLALIGKQLGAGRWKLFEDLEEAKVEAKATYERIAAARTAWGFPTSIMEPALQDLMRQEAKNVPDLFV